MKIVVAIILLFISSFFVADVEGKSNTHIIWLTDDVNDQQNYLQGNQVSIGTDTTNLVLKALKNYQLEFKLAPIPRINLLLKSQDNICVGNRIKTKERAAENVFSLPVNIYPGVRLYFLQQFSAVPKSLLNEFSEVISLPELFIEFPTKILGVSQGRSFGRYLDSQLSVISSENVMLRGGTGRYTALRHMLFKGRIDYLLDFPTEMKRNVDTYPYSVVIKSFAIAHNSDLIAGHIACSNTDVGREFISKVNEILVKLYQNSSFYQAHARYISQHELPAFELTFKNYFKVDTQAAIQ